MQIIHNEDDLIAARCSGRFQSADFAALLVRISGAGGRGLLLEMQDVDFCVPSSAMRSAAWAISSDDDRLPAKVAFVANDQLAFGMLRIFTSVMERTSESFDVFADHPSAFQWLSEKPIPQLATSHLRTPNLVTIWKMAPSIFVGHLAPPVA